MTNNNAPLPLAALTIPVSTSFDLCDMIMAIDAAVSTTTNGYSNGHKMSSYSAPVPSTSAPTLLDTFMASQAAVDAHKSGKPVTIDGHNLTIPAVVAAARYSAPISLDGSSEIKSRMFKAERAIDEKLETGKSVYGISTGFGGSADTRTNQHLALGKALLQHQHSGVLPSFTHPGHVASEDTKPLPLSDPLNTLSMPEAWVRAAILIRINSLIRGHSGVRWVLLERMVEILEKNITPLVPLRGSISASGDLSPLSYVAGTIFGNEQIRVYHGKRCAEAPREITSSRAALEAAGIEPLKLAPKEHLGLLNGTAFSAAVASLALNDAVHMGMLAQVLTAMGTEALVGTQASHHPFIHAVARPHPGQVESAQQIWNLLEGSSLAQRGEEKEVTIEKTRDILHAWSVVTQECNTTTDNPLVDGETGHVHHGGNFQAMAVTNAMEKTRLALHHLGKILFAQSTELLNPAFNRGLPPSLAASDPSVNYHAKGLDIATAARRPPCPTHELAEGMAQIVNEELANNFTSSGLHSPVFKHHGVVRGDLDDGCCAPHAYCCCCSFCTTHRRSLGSELGAIPAFRESVAVRSAELYERLRAEYLTGKRGPAPAAELLGNTRPVYEFVRVKLGVKMHGLDNLNRFEHGWTDLSIGQNVALIYEAIRDGRMQEVVASLWKH
ncbi:phenylalanine ammonia-lyase [Ceratobasidium sp. AG-Ba]|nr:phenylalanine ammonia-lyase [Ceratobasidium sp. AG-Ba]